jgi:hypothetical protein
MHRLYRSVVSRLGTAPTSRARATASARLVMCNFSKPLLTYFCTVFSDRYSCSAIAALP